MQHIVPVQSSFFAPGKADEIIRGLANKYATGIPREQQWAVLGFGPKGVCVIAFCDDAEWAISVQRMYDLCESIDVLAITYIGPFSDLVTADEVANIFAKD